MIKNLVFDLGGVVAILDPEEAFSRFERLGVADTRQQMGVYGQTGIFRQIEDGTLTPEEFCRQLAIQAHKPSCTYEEAQWAWLGFIKEIPLQRLENLLALKRKYNVYLLSNTNPFIMQWARSERFSPDGHSIEYYFHHTYCSYELKDYKPSHTIFRSMMSDAGIQPAESVFIDDGPKNVAASEEVGMHGLLVKKDEDWMLPLMSFLTKLND